MESQYGVYYFQSEQIYLQGTQKKGCFEVREFLLYPEYSVDFFLSVESSMK